MYTIPNHYSIFIPVVVFIYVHCFRTNVIAIDIKSPLDSNLDSAMYQINYVYRRIRR